ncbi:pyrroline-5-carboxylate reductase [Aurantimonas sp. 22II-16-19i]|uniref:pyrroline-5-carboxylate reductase n=1 Tax=Aurantimonas sp. 22II-16-19i TaxID=1317114 RepID=UPI0009F7A458|nr:pyrroline-5-carboxylate reductase [Aurantimonas sp. 22II-16-19i]ORE98042.1 pyrroline-5-carboxylate reductase [Aurantimonas sp. 22II-16-19i]
MIDARILLLGGGNMGSALLGGWLDKGLAAEKVTVVDPAVGPALQPLIDKGVTHRPSVPAGEFDIVLLAVKPQMMTAAVPPLKAAMRPETLVVSIAAGTTIAAIEALLGPHPVVRAMPNTPALIGRGVTGAYGNARCGETERAAATALLEASGPVEWVGEERLIDAVTAVSGSGPAYVFHLAECMAKAGEALGLAPDLAMRLARHTVAGAGELMIRSSDAPAQLRRNVTSPNGTTQAALEVLMDDERLARLMEEAMRAARDRAEELSRG